MSIQGTHFGAIPSIAVPSSPAPAHSRTDASIQTVVQERFQAHAEKLAAK